MLARLTRQRIDLVTCKVLPRRFTSSKPFYERIDGELATIQDSGLFKSERLLLSPQSSQIRVQKTAGGEGGSQSVVNFCANNYLGLCDHPAIIEAGIQALKAHGAGLSSVRFICGTHSLHKELEGKLSDFYGTEDTILYSSCFDANTGFFETLLGSEDAILSDTLNHASLIDGIRLCKAHRYRYAHNDMADLERLLREARSKEHETLLIATDGVFSMDGEFALLPQICKLAEQYGALVMVDDSHATGFIGKRGRGTAEYFGLQDRVDVITSTMGKALGGSSGGFTTGKANMIALLRQRSRPYLFSNTLAPVIAAMAGKALDLVDSMPQLRARLLSNTTLFRTLMAKEGFRLMGDPIHPIAPVMIGDARIASQMADELLQQGIYVIGFSYPVVPKDLARIRVQISASHTPQQITHAVEAFAKTAHKHNLLN